MADPFLQVRQQAAATLAAAERQHTKWGEARRRKPVRQDECKLLLAELLSSLEAVEADLADLEEVLAVVERNRAKFPHLDNTELTSRKSFVIASRRVTLSIREDLSTHAPKSARVAGSRRSSGGTEREGLLASGEADTPVSGAGGAASSSSGDGGGGTREIAAACEEGLATSADSYATSANSYAMRDQQQQQQQQLDMQEEALDGLSAAVGRIKSMGHEMKDEISMQSRMMASLEDQVDGATSAMASLKGKMKEMANTKDRGKCCAIAVLSVALFGLTSLVLYT